MSKDLTQVILKALREQNSYISGETLAQKFGVSRQGLWKHISKLKDKGYEIAAVPHLGYQLRTIPDKLYPYEIQNNLNTKFIGKNIQYFETIDSTQDVAWELGLGGCAQGTLVVSETQKKGRGRLHRRWLAPRGGIYFSLILRPQSLLINEVPKITLLAGLSCIYGIKKVVDLDLSLKWPNDILLGDKKLGGILCELDAEQDIINFIVLGIGINVNTKDLPQSAASLFLYGKRKFPRVDILKSILEEMEVLYERAQKNEFSSILKEWESFCSLWGSRVRVKILDREVEGEAVGIDERGHLLLRKENGLLETVSAGDVEKLNVNHNSK
jgi:BirA family biotin operon repressor/biotin-[acetyl-CoA-carboxylase] ligase